MALVLGVRLISHRVTPLEVVNTGALVIAVHDAGGTKLVAVCKAKPMPLAGQLKTRFAPGPVALVRILSCGWLRTTLA